MDPLRLFLLDQGFPVEHELDKFNMSHRNNFTSPPKLAMSTAIPNSAPTPSYFTSGQHFLETCTLLPKTIRATKSQWRQRLFPQTANVTFAKPLWAYLPRASKNLHVKANGIFVFLLLHPPLLTTTISEGITLTCKNTFLRPKVRTNILNR